MSDKMVEALELYYGVSSEELDTFICKSWQAAWQASRAALVVDLEYAHRSMGGGPIGGTMWSDEVYDAIHAAGVKTK